MEEDGGWESERTREVDVEYSLEMGERKRIMKR